MSRGISMNGLRNSIANAGNSLRSTPLDLRAEDDRDLDCSIGWLESALDIARKLRSQPKLGAKECAKCHGSRCINVLGSGGDYETWPCPVCRPTEYERSISSQYG